MQDSLCVQGVQFAHSIGHDVECGVPHSLAGRAGRICSQACSEEICRFLLVGAGEVNALDSAMQRSLQLFGLDQHSLRQEKWVTVPTLIRQWWPFGAAVDSD